MRNIKLEIEYDGTGYCGWQSQTNGMAIQDILQEAVEKLTGERCTLHGSGRTDAGVHALGQVANFITGSCIPAEKFSYALNGFLPDDIVIKDSCEVDMSFHSRRNAIAKKYRYLIYNRSHPSALLRNRAFHVPYVLDAGLMKEGVVFFTGRHDFSAFTATGSSVLSTERMMTGASIEQNGPLIEFEITGNGFLYNMVRIMSGTLVDVGRGRLNPENIIDIIESRDRKNAGKTAPAHGLYLVEVYY